MDKFDAKKSYYEFWLRLQHTGGNDTLRKSDLKLFLVFFIVQNVILQGFFFKDLSTSSAI